MCDFCQAVMFVPVFKTVKLKKENQANMSMMSWKFLLSHVAIGMNAKL